MNRITIVFALALSSLLLAATAATAQSGATQPVSAADSHYFHNIATEGQSEIQLAQLAEQKAADPQVKQYAQNVLAADTAMEQKVKQLLPNAANGSTPEPSAEYRKLAGVAPPRFDEEYMQYEAQRQEADLQMVRNEISTTNDANVLEDALLEEIPIQEAAAKADRIEALMAGQEKTETASRRRAG